MFDTSALEMIEMSILVSSFLVTKFECILDFMIQWF